MSEKEIKRWRFELGLSQETLAHIIGTSQATVSRIEDGTRPLREEEKRCFLKFIDAIEESIEE